MQNHAAPLRHDAVFEQIDALPRSQGHAPAYHGNGKMRLRQRRADVRGHVVGAFERVPVTRGVAWFVFGRQALKEIRQVEHHVRIGVFLDQQRRQRCAGGTR